MNEHNEPKELEEWMTTWQGHKEPMLARDAYMKTLWNQRIADYGSIFALVAGVGVFGWVVVVRPSFFAWSCALFFVPYFFWAIWKIWQRIKAEVRALPLSSTEYLNVVDHNLRLLENENLWERRTVIPLLVAALFVCLWQIDRGSGSLRLYLIVGTVVLTVFPYTIYETFFSKPKKLAGDRTRLDNLRSAQDDIGSL